MSAPYLEPFRRSSVFEAGGRISQVSLAMGNKATKPVESPIAFGSLGPTRTPALIRSLLEVIQQTLLRLSSAAVEKGDRFYSVAILRKSDLALIAVGRDKTTTKDPTATAELCAIQAFFSLQERPHPQECIFLCVHEPAAMALYQFAVCGFDNFVFLFDRETSASLGAGKTGLPLNRIFSGATEDEGYHASNDFWKARKLMEMIDTTEKREEYLQTVEAIQAAYREMMKPEKIPILPAMPDKDAANA